MPLELQNDPRYKVTLSSATEYSDAINILGKMAIKTEGKTIVDQTGQKGPIEIDIPPMHWKMALIQILRHRGLSFEEFPNYYLVKTGSEEKAGGGPGKSAGPKEEAFTSDTREVKINAIFFQADREKLKEAGINWNIVQNSSGLSLKTLNIGANFGVTTDKQAEEGQITGRTLAHKTTDEDGSVDVEALLNLYESNDLGKVLSKPTIKVVDGVEGQIHVGTQFAINQKDFSGNTVSQYKNAGTILKVTPQIIEDSTLTFIHLIISAEKSSASPGMGEQPEVSTQKAETSVLLLDGEQTMIGGLYVQEELVIRTGIPILKDLPWWVFGIRYLTGYNSTTIKNNELIIFIKVELMDKLEDRIAKRKQSILGKELQKEALQTRKDFIELKKSSDEGQKVSNKELKGDKDYKVNREELLEKPLTEAQPDKIEVKTEQQAPPVQPQVAKEKEIEKTETEEVVAEKQSKPISKETEQIIKKFTKTPAEEKTKVITKPTERKKPETITYKTLKENTESESKTLPKANITTPKVAPVPPVSTTVKKQAKQPNQIEEMLNKKVDDKQAEKIEKIVEAKKVTRENLKPRYTIQIFSSDNYQKTLEEIKKYKARGIDVYIEKQKIDNKLMYRVRAGRFVYFSKAKEEMKKIQEKFPERKDMWIDNL
jgi:type IV pilus assembly protein PilQ